MQPFAAVMNATVTDADAGAGRSTLDEMALALAAVLRPDLDLIEQLAVLDQLAADCPTPTRDGVMQHLFADGRFRGDRSDYHHWSNSCLDVVLQRRRGMPITLSVVGIEVARRVGVRLVGIGMPGHFLVGDPDDPTWFADPFHGRHGLSAQDCRAIVASMGLTRWSDRFLGPTPDRFVIARMLNNLKASCERRGDVVRLALVMQARQEMAEFADEHDEALRALAPLN